MEGRALSRPINFWDDTAVVPPSKKRQLRFVLVGAGEADAEADEADGFAGAREGFAKQRAEFLQLQEHRQESSAASPAAAADHA